MNPSNPQTPPNFQQDLAGLSRGISSAATDSHEYQYAGFWVRLFAYLIDVLLIMLLMVPYFLWQWYRYADVPLEAMPVFDPLELIINIGFAILWIWFWVKKAATPGKMLFGLQILDAQTGNMLTVKQAILRYLGYIPSGIFLCLGYIWIGFDAKKQGWHDKIAKTVVVKKLS